VCVLDRGTPANHHEVAPAEAWDAIAQGYDELVAPGEASFAHAGLALAGLRVGDRFMDVAAGQGGLSLPAARLGARVLATDWSPATVERFTAHVCEEQLRDAEARVMDAHALDAEDDTFDVTGSQFGVMLVPDQLVAFAGDGPRDTARRAGPGDRLRLTGRIRASPWCPTSRGYPTIPRRWSSRWPIRTCYASA
jgi:hypothetical protein